ncbi:uncharacterized protein LOC120632487 isoform X2 [Pararge aegeria]|uniref:Jg14770 protein n=1 Tax=Pararge aegeria aegeria TaxID=348720 RepID=A0A8S4SJE8_9NEOP|nr:uncharacterized protein LOC120632487 isoform X2 [Pararge aegeria]CAH2267304.1 jg14770 [Pararge aegeria aegeria]
MDGSILERSDSESGDSWTLLEHSPSPGDDAPDFTEPLLERAENHEKDEDTDGISIISDSEPDSPSPCQLYEHYVSDDIRPTENEITQCISANQPPNKTDDQVEPVREDIGFLSVNDMKHRTYVHRRNKRLSTMLNIIVLGSVITAAGVAIGHMWGAKTDCSMHTTPNVNKILSNLYKLQEENAYLRSKLKELTTLNHYQINIQKTSKQNRCRKMFEESLNNDNIDKLTKCLDNKFDDADKMLKSHLVDPNYEKEFISDIDKLKNVYLQNKSWLDDEINQRLKQEEESLKKLKHKHISKLHKINEEKNTNIMDEQETVTKAVVDNLDMQDESMQNSATDKIVSYADSLKSTDKIKKLIENKEDNKTYKVENKEMNSNKNFKRESVRKFDYSVSEEEFQKDNRYKNQKYKPEKQKKDRQKSNKKQKRKNKYEQWEMKGGFMKDYDEISFASSQDAESGIKNENSKYEIEDNITHHKDNTKNDKQADKIDMTAENYKTIPDKGPKKGYYVGVDGSSWLEKRATFRSEARKRIEHELFGESPNTAGWYFRRMRKREQCRAKGDNSTYRKLLKRNMNFKMKH